METLTVERTTPAPAAGLDPTWRGLYRAGGVSAGLYVVLGMIVPAVLFSTSHYNASMGGKATLAFIASNRSWWILIQTLTLMPSVFAIIAFLALYMALKHLNKSYAAMGVVVAITCQIVFLGYLPIVMGLVYMSDHYGAATTDTEHATLATGASSLVAVNSAPSFMEIVFGISILVLSLVMLKGVFHKSVAYLGIATFAVALIGVALQPLLGIAYLWWWAFFMIWLLAVGWKLYRIGGSEAPPANNTGDS